MSRNSNKLGVDAERKKTLQQNQPLKQHQTQCPRRIPSKIPVLRRPSQLRSESSRMDESEPEYSEIGHAPHPANVKFNKFRKNTCSRAEMPEYIRKSHAKQSKRGDNPKRNQPSHNAEMTMGDVNLKVAESLKCHVYETVTPRKPKFLRYRRDPPNEGSTSEDEYPVYIQEHAVVHPPPVVLRHPQFGRRHSTIATPANSARSRLIKDENGALLSPILNEQHAAISPPHPPGKVCRANLEDRFVVNTYSASCWQRLGGRGKARIDATQFVKVTARRDSGIHSDNSSDSDGKYSNQHENNRRKLDARAVQAGSDAGDQTSSMLTPKSTTTAVTSPSAVGVLSDVGLVGELYRARITPDKILARKLKLRQRRVVPTSLLGMFDDSTEEPATTESPCSLSDREFISFLDREASKIESEVSDVDSLGKMASDEAIYATPLKTPKKPTPSSLSSDSTERCNSTTMEDACTRTGSDHENFIKLKEEADYQCKIMRQASKALEVSRKSEWRCQDVRPQVEAEKILLTASCKYEKVLQEIRQTHYEKPIDAKQTGSVSIADISVGLTTLTAEQTGWFVLVLMDDKRIYSTTPVEVPQHHRRLDFPRRFLFDRLDATFELTAKIYCLPHRKCEKPAKKAEGRLSNKLRLSGRKLRYMDLYTKDPVENNIVTSSFAPMGYFKITVADLQQAPMVEKKLTLYETSPLGGDVTMNLTLAEMKMDVEKIGMLNVRSMSNPVVWNRRWCTLRGTAMRFWNSPLDESFREPVTTINLVHACQEIGNARREVCPRPKTLEVVTSKGTYYLNIDTSVELREWRKMLNDVYRGLRDWKLLQG